MWSYISRNIFKLAIVEGEVGSSTMPHKVNPIDFENAEGNLGLANSMFDFLSNKLPISRLQRDLTDSTVVRNIGVAFGYSLVAYKSIIKGLDKIDINYDAMSKELKNNTVVIAEAIQQILRSAGIEESYDKVKELTRKNPPPTMFDIQEFIMDLDVDKVVVDRLLQVKPETYTGIYPKDYQEEIYDVPNIRNTETLSFEVSKRLLEKALNKK
jgi:adenylosuccinate lyase